MKWLINKTPSFHDGGTLHDKPTKHLMMFLKCTFSKSVDQYWKTHVAYSEQQTAFILCLQKYKMLCYLILRTQLRGFYLQNIVMY
jgi:hypothetical protein